METTKPVLSYPSLSYTEAWLPSFDGTMFYTRTWHTKNPRAAIIYVAGWADHISRYDDTHAKWSEHDITLFSYDPRGFGKTALDEAKKSSNSSYGKTSRHDELLDLQWWVDHVKNKYPKLPIFLMGFSAVRKS
jgi:acylglycerol lipase